MDNMDAWLGNIQSMCPICNSVWKKKELSLRTNLGRRDQLEAVQSVGSEASQEQLLHPIHKFHFETIASASWSVASHTLTPALQHHQGLQHSKQKTFSQYWVKLVPVNVGDNVVSVA